MEDTALHLVSAGLELERTVDDGPPLQGCFQVELVPDDLTLLLSEKLPNFQI